MEEPTQALRRQAAERLLQHRRRRGRGGQAQAGLPDFAAGANAALTPEKPNRIADSVAARFAKSVSYRDFLKQEAENAMRQAEAAAEVARRSAEAITAAQTQLLQEIEQWNRQAEMPGEAAAAHEPAQVIAMPAPAGALGDAPGEAYSVLAPSESRIPSDLPTPASVVATDMALASAQAQKPAVAVNVTVVEAPVVQPPATPAAAAKPVLPLPSEPLEPPTPLPTNLIEFPRQLVAARKARPRFAEGPLREDADEAPERAQLRIFEVEADAFSTEPAIAEAASLPEWSSIRLDSWAEPHETTVADAQVSFALPIYTAPVERRVMAALVDGCCVATAFLLAVAAAAMAGDALPSGLFAAGASAATLLLFGIGYMLLCFTLSGQTVGMRYARIALCTFGDDNPTRASMRRRLLAVGLSGVTLGLGFAWALLDDDKLGWHDRISRMYQRAY